MSFFETLNTLLLPTSGVVLGLGLGLLWRAGQVARAQGLSLPDALRVVLNSLFGR